MVNSKYQEGDIVFLNSYRLLGNDVWPGKVVTARSCEFGVEYLIKLYFWNEIVEIEEEEEVSSISYGLMAVMNTECPELVYAVDEMNKDRGVYFMNPPLVARTLIEDIFYGDKEEGGESYFESTETDQKEVLIPKYQEGDTVCITPYKFYDLKLRKYYKNEVWPGRVWGVLTLEFEVKYLIRIYYCNKLIEISNEDNIYPIIYCLLAEINTEYPELVKAIDEMYKEYEIDFMNTSIVVRTLIEDIFASDEGDTSFPQSDGESDFESAKTEEKKMFTAKYQDGDVVFINPYRLYDINSYKMYENKIWPGKVCRVGTYQFGVRYEINLYYWNKQAVVTDEEQICPIIDGLMMIVETLKSECPELVNALFEMNEDCTTYFMKQSHNIRAVTEDTSHNQQEKNFPTTDEKSTDCESTKTDQAEETHPIIDIKRTVKEFLAKLQKDIQCLMESLIIKLDEQDELDEQ